MSTFREIKAIMLQPILQPAPLSDQDIDDLMRQEPLPANQPFQLSASEQPTENQPTYIETN